MNCNLDVMPNPVFPHAGMIGSLMNATLAYLGGFQDTPVYDIFQTLNSGSTSQICTSAGLMATSFRTTMSPFLLSVEW
jgi:hypothetical protein